MKREAVLTWGAIVLLGGISAWLGWWLGQRALWPDEKPAPPGMVSKSTRSGCWALSPQYRQPSTSARGICNARQAPSSTAYSRLCQKPCFSRWVVRSSASSA